VLASWQQLKKGLTSTEAQERLAKYGKNELDAGEKKPYSLSF
jgi:Ca2+-transporting ATPase